MRNSDIKGEKKKDLLQTSRIRPGAIGRQNNNENILAARSQNLDSPDANTGGKSRERRLCA